jgi:cell wall assembly regulator SMI1
MASISVYDAKPPVGAAEIDVFEARVGVSLPRPYREWLLKHNGGQPSPSGFRYNGEVGPYTDGNVAWFYAIYDGGISNLEIEFLVYKVDANRLPQNLIPIATDPFGNQIVLSVAGADVGKVYFWDHEEEPIPPSYANCHLIADSFDEFIEGLH